MGKKWIYGKQDWKTLERGQEYTYLMTDGAGGYSSMTMIGSASRNDHAFFIACTEAPNHRYNMIHRIFERLEVGEESYILSSQQFLWDEPERGYLHLVSFAYEDTPVWRFLAGGVEIEKEAAIGIETGAVGIRYRIRNKSGCQVRLHVTPFYQFASKGEEPDRERPIICIPGTAHGEGYVTNGKLKLYYTTDGENETGRQREEIYYYEHDACDGRRDHASAWSCHEFYAKVADGCEAQFSIVFSMEKDVVRTGEGASHVMEEMIQILKDVRERAQRRAGFTDEIASFLVKSAGQFVSRRESTGGKTILAGFPFFSDWGRDTMIALPGICICTGQFETAKSVLRTFAAYERGGLMPNLFPEGQSEPMYNTVDAALLFINCVWHMFEAERDECFVREMYPVMERIIDGYENGADYSIKMDVGDGLISAGEGLDQVTWMDVRAGEILPTPRHGKPVEVNAYWYNALRIMERFARMMEGDGSEAQSKYNGRGRRYRKMAERAAASFTEKFWMDDKRCLRDVVSGTEADEQIRCNQIWAVSMPFTILDTAREKEVVDTVFAKLYTPYGLRTLSPDDEQFQPYYSGNVLSRDLAYHQGTIWVFPLGAYYLSYLKVNGYKLEAKEWVRRELETMENAMREGCIGQLPEIYDGGNPVLSKGCFAQAWSVGEILRVYAALEKMIPDAFPHVVVNIKRKQSEAALSQEAIQVE